MRLNIYLHTFLTSLIHIKILQKMKKSLSELKGFLTVTEKLTEKQMFHLKGGDGEDLRRKNGEG